MSCKLWKTYPNSLQCCRKKNVKLFGKILHQLPHRKSPECVTRTTCKFWTYRENLANVHSKQTRVLCGQFEVTSLATRRVAALRRRGRGDRPRRLSPYNCRATPCFCPPRMRDTLALQPLSYLHRPFLKFNLIQFKTTGRVTEQVF